MGGARGGGAAHTHNESAQKKNRERDRDNFTAYAIYICDSYTIDIYNR